MRAETIENLTSLAFGLASYTVAKNTTGVDRVPAMLIGAFVGKIIGSQIAETVSVYKPKRRKRR